MNSTNHKRSNSSHHQFTLFSLSSLINPRFHYNTRTRRCRPFRIIYIQRPSQPLLVFVLLLLLLAADADATARSLYYIIITVFGFIEDPRCLFSVSLFIRLFINRRCNESPISFHADVLTIYRSLLYDECMPDNVLSFDYSRTLNQHSIDELLYTCITACCPR